MRRLGAAVTLALACTVVGTPRLVAASCAQQTLADQIARADVVVFGTVTSVRMTLVAAGGVVSFRPERVLKGTLTHSAQVYLGPSHGGAVTSVDYQAAAPQSHTLFLRDAKDGSFETDVCSGSHEGPPSAEEVRVLGQGTSVAVAPEPPPLPIVLVVVAAAAVAIAAAALAVRRRRRAG